MLDGRLRAGVSGALHPGSAVAADHPGGAVVVVLVGLNPVRLTHSTRLGTYTTWAARGDHHRQHSRGLPSVRSDAVCGVAARIALQRWRMQVPVGRG
jgi:hypothetical protein